MIQIRQGVFETNSSSVHTMTICSKEDYNKWVSGEVLMLNPDYYKGNKGMKQFLTEDEVKKIDLNYPYINCSSDYSEKYFYSNKGEQLYIDSIPYITFTQYISSISYEFYSYKEEKNINGTDVIVFGYHGYSG